MAPLTMWAAITGLGGVILGGLLTMWSQYALERRRERRGVRGIARLVREEFVRGMAEGRFLGVYSVGQEVTVEINVYDDFYRQHRAALAEHLSGDEFSQVMTAANGRRSFMRFIEGRRNVDEQLVVDDFTRKRTQDFIRACSQGTQVLGKPAGLSWRARRKIRRTHIRLTEGD